MAVLIAPINGAIGVTKLAVWLESSRATNGQRKTYLNRLGHLKDVFNKREDEFLEFLHAGLVDHVDDGLEGGGQHLGTLQFAFHGGQYMLAPHFLDRSESKHLDGSI